MKRRDFLTASAALAGATVPAFLRAQSPPCPPPTISGGGGAPVSTVCGDGSAESDWIVRSTGPGVQWAHDFRTDAEAIRFRVGPTSQFDRIRRITTDGITGGGCLEIFTPVGGHTNAAWARPFNPFPGDRGYVSGPSMPPDWNSVWGNWRNGLYGHPDYHDSTDWQGHEFYIQFRYKASASAFDGGNPDSGKLAYVDIAGGGNQELILQSPIYGSRRFWMYTNFGSRSNSNLNSTQGQSTPASDQPGGAYASSCIYPSYINCWQWPTDQWVTVLLHVVPGHHNGDSNQPNMASPSNIKDHAVQVWVAGANERSYTKIWDKSDYVWNYDSTTTPNKFGFNVFTPSAYMNNVSSATAWFRRFGQIIFSKQFIACPQA